MESAFKLTWDYKPKAEYVIDWNQTLITRINQISANIYQSSLHGGANHISINPVLLPLIETLEYYKKSTNTLSGRYVINLDVTLPKDKLYVYQSGFPMEPMVHSVNGLNEVTVIHSESPQIEEYRNKEHVNIITPDRLIGEITILNYD